MSLRDIFCIFFAANALTKFWDLALKVDGELIDYMNALCSDVCTYRRRPMLGPDLTLLTSSLSR